jgi:hypothetical protein
MFKGLRFKDLLFESDSLCNQRCSKMQIPITLPSVALENLFIIVATRTSDSRMVYIDAGLYCHLKMSST